MTTIAELESQLDQASADADQRFIEIGIQLVEGETIDLDAESVITTLAASGRGLPELKRLRNRLQARRDACDNRRRAAELLARREQLAQELASKRAEASRMQREHEAAMRPIFVEIGELTDEISRAGHEATDWENTAVSTLKSTAAAGSSPWDWRNCSLDFPAPAPGLEGLPTI